jgi:hypothetical protein
MSAEQNTKDGRDRKKKQKRFMAEQMAWPSKMSNSANVKSPSKQMEMGMSAREKKVDMQLIGLAEKNSD